MFRCMRRVAPLGLTIVLGLVGCGGTKIVTTTTTNTATLSLTNTTTQSYTVTKYRQQAPTVTVVHTTTSTVPASVGAGLSFSGNGGESLGTIHVPTDSVLEWTNDGGVFTVQDTTDAIFVNSQGSSGRSSVSAGTYHDVAVNAVGNWTIHIVPH